ncbi:MAG: radical SAM protein [Planctomycetota bacterium]
MESIDALFLSYFEDVDRWSTDLPDTRTRATGSPARLVGRDDPNGATILARSARQAVTVDGRTLDQSRFFSLAAHGTTSEYRRYDTFSISHLSGKYYESLGARHGYRVRHVNVATRVDLERLSAEVTPRWLMVSSTFMTEPAHLLEALQHARRAFPGVPVCVGGLFLVEVEKSVAPRDWQRLLLSLRADVYAVTPLGEAAFLELLKHDSADVDPARLPGAWVKEGRTFVKSDAAEPGLPIDDHWVRWDELAQDGIYHTVHTRTARSCAFACAFCSYPANQGALTLSSPDTLRAELESMKRSGRVRSIVFTDDTFNVPMPRFVELVDVLKDFDFEWYSYFRSQFATEDVVARMVDSGCRGVFLGYESIDDVVLKNMRKAVNRKAYERGTELIVDAGLMTHANFIVGFPGDRPENADEILRFVDDFGVDTYHVTPWFCSPATPIFGEDQRERFGIEGKYLRWKHDTMTSEEALEIEDWSINRAKESVWTTDLGGRSFWTSVMLMANGLSRDDLRRATRAFGTRVGVDQPLAELEADPEFQWTRERLRAAAFPEPPDARLFQGPLPPEREGAPRRGEAGGEAGAGTATGSSPEPGSASGVSG